MKKIIKKPIKKVKLSKVEGTKCIPEMTMVASSFDNVQNKNTISMLEIDLGRDDLNLLKEKINEVIKKICQ